MASSTEKNLIKSLLTTLPHGAPIPIETLNNLGISSALASHYVKTGWLERLGRGLFSFKGDTLQRDLCLKFLQNKTNGFHVGGKTALSWRGIHHNLTSNEQLILWGNISLHLPDWFTSRFRSHYSAQHLFDASLPENYGLQFLPEDLNSPLVSVPERALLEMLSAVGLRQGIEESRNIMESLQTIRPEVLDILLGKCSRIKVVRLCVQWSEELNLNWASVARQSAKHFGSNSRWSKSLPDGTTLILKR